MFDQIASQRKGFGNRFKAMFGARKIKNGGCRSYFYIRVIYLPVADTISSVWNPRPDN